MQIFRLLCTCTKIKREHQSIITLWEVNHPANVLSVRILFTFILLNLYIMIIIIYNIIVLLLLKSTMSRTFKLLNASGKHVYGILKL